MQEIKYREDVGVTWNWEEMASKDPEVRDQRWESKTVNENGHEPTEMGNHSILAQGIAWDLHKMQAL